MQHVRPHCGTALGRGGAVLGVRGGVGIEGVGVRGWEFNWIGCDRVIGVGRVRWLGGVGFGGGCVRGEG